jgi:hypothetical protein
MTERMVGVASALMAVLVFAPATAHAEDPVPSVDEVVAVMAELTDPDIPAANKTNVVSPGFSLEEAGMIDDRLHRTAAVGLLPYNFVVTDIQPAPNNFAGATLSTVGSPRQHSPDRPIVLVDQGGRWLITHDSAMAELNVLWSVAHRYIPPAIK